MSVFVQNDAEKAPRLGRFVGFMRVYAVLRLPRLPFGMARRAARASRAELNNPSGLPLASHLPLHRGGYNKVTPSAALPAAFQAGLTPGGR